MFGGRAAAHDPPHATGIVWFSDGVLERNLVRTNRGLILTEDQGKTFRLLCNDAFGALLQEVAPVVFTYDGRLLVGTYAKGLLEATPDLCTFGIVQGRLAGISVVALETSPGAPHSLFALLAKDGSDEHLFSSTDDGRTWLVPSRTEDFLFSLRVSPSDSARLYGSALSVGDGGHLSYRVLVSSDSGQNFRPHDIVLDDNESGLQVLAVDPLDPDRAFVRTVAADPPLPERLLRTDFTEVMLLAGPTHMATTKDGSTLWIGSREGVLRSTDHGATFERLDGAGLRRISCLELHDGRLFACGESETAVGVFVSSDHGASFSSYLQFPQVKERLPCPTGSNESRICGPSFEDWRLEQGTSANPTADAGLDVGTSPRDASIPEVKSAPPHEGCSCSMGQRSSTSAGGSAWVVVAAALLLERWAYARSRLSRDWFSWVRRIGKVAGTGSESRAPQERLG